MSEMSLHNFVKLEEIPFYSFLGFFFYMNNIVLFLQKMGKFLLWILIVFFNSKYRCKVQLLNFTEPNTVKLYFCYFSTVLNIFAQIPCFSNLAELPEGGSAVTYTTGEMTLAPPFPQHRSLYAERTGTLHWGFSLVSWKPSCCTDWRSAGF